MHFSVILLLPVILRVTYAVPIGNSTAEVQPVEVKPEEAVPKDNPISGIPVDNNAEVIPIVVIEKESPASAEVADAGQSSGETTTVQPQSDSGERDGRQVEEDDDDEGNTEDDDDDEEEDDGEEEEEEEERKLPPPKAAAKSGSKKKAPAGKPVPVLGEGVEDDEAEDLGIFEREEVKSDEKSDEEKSEEDQHDEDDDESGEEERNDRPTGLVADPSSNERGDAFDTPASPSTQNEVNESERPLAVAVVQREEENLDPVVPVIVEDATGDSQISQLGQSSDKPRKNKPKKEADDEDEDEDDEDEDEEEDAARSEKVSQARAAYPSPVLYYYPFPESP